MNALTKTATIRAEFNCSRVNRENYLIATVAGIVIGVMFAMFV